MAIGVKPDGHKVVLAVSRDREATASWSGLLRELKARGMNEPRLVIGDRQPGPVECAAQRVPGRRGAALLGTIVW